MDRKYDNSLKTKTVGTPELLFDLPFYHLSITDVKTGFYTKTDNKWEKTSIQKFTDLSDQLSRALLSLDIKKGDKIGVVSSYNCTYWHILDMALSQIGCIMVPVYPMVSLETFEYIFNHAEINYCFVSDADLLSKITSIRPEIPSLKDIFSFEEIDDCPHIEEIIKRGQGTAWQPQLEEIKKTILPDDVVSIIYTSGTTGIPKGVMLSHRNLLSTSLACAKRLHNMDEGYVALSFLPTCHVYERMMIYLYLYRGFNIYFAESLEKVSENIREVRPHIISSVPRFLEKIFQKIYTKGSDLKGIKKKLFFWSLKVAKNYNPSSGKCLSLWISRKLVLNKIKHTLGSRLEVIVSGGASLHVKLWKMFSAVGFYVLDGYGLTEASPVISVNENIPFGISMGTSGKPLDCVEVKIAEDGEILCKGPNIMKGYFKDIELTAKTIKDGYLYTGDIGFIDENGFLKITDRKKQIFKTSGGKYIAPQPIEDEMRGSPYVEQVMVVGEGEKLAGALIQPDFEKIKSWATKHLSKDEMEDRKFLQHPKVIQLYEKEIKFYNRKFNSWEQVKKFQLTPDLWTVEEGLLTPTFKIKRHAILGKYKNLYDMIYDF